MYIDLKYGKSLVRLDVDMLGNARVLAGGEGKVLTDLGGEVLAKLKMPTGSESLASEIRRKRAQSVAVIVNDVTRPTPYRQILPPLLEELQEAGIGNQDVKFLVATGIHRGMTPDEMRTTLGDDIVSTYKVENHDCDDDESLVYLGRLSFGTELFVNRLVTDTDFVIATGVIAPHYFAGFSGGRKAILPGVSGRKTVAHNHSLMTDENATVCNLARNPVHLEMMEAARKVGVGFMVNVAVDGRGQTVAVVAGDIEKAWLAGVAIGSSLFIVHIDEPADVVIASAGGYPKDINIYQAQKAIDNAARAVAPGGTIVLLAQCPEGCGEPTFEQWMLSARSVDDIFHRFSAGFELGGHKAYSLARVLKDKEVVLVSALDEGFVRRLFFTPAASLEDALSYVRSKHGAAFTSVVMPNAGIVVPSRRVVSGGGDSE